MEILILEGKLPGLKQATSTILTGFARDAQKETGPIAKLQGHSEHRDQNQVKRMDLGENADQRGLVG